MDFRSGASRGEKQSATFLLKSFSNSVLLFVLGRNIRETLFCYL